MRWAIFGREVDGGVFPLAEPSLANVGETVDCFLQCRQQRLHLLSDFLIALLDGGEQSGFVTGLFGAAADFVGLPLGFDNDGGGLSLRPRRGSDRPDRQHLQN